MPDIPERPGKNHFPTDSIESPPRPSGICTIAITQRKNGHTYITHAKGKSIVYEGGGPGEAPTAKVDSIVS